MLEPFLELFTQNEEGEPSKLRISNLPGRSDITTTTLGELALREGATYRFEIDSNATSVDLEPRELFDPDDANAKSGRLRPGQAVGRIRIQIIDRNTRLTSTTDVDVLAVKLDHETEYRQMLADIASFASEAMLQGFAPSLLDLAPSQLPAELLYLRFAMIVAYVQNPVFEAAIALVTSQPHRAWISERETRPAGSPFPSGSAFRRAVRSPGPRVRWDCGPAQLVSLPTVLTRDRTEESFDNSANQFVKFVLERWRAVTSELRSLLRQPNQTVETGPLRRGRKTADDLAARLDQLLAHPLFLEVSSLHRMPTSDQVLLKRSGYREIFRAFAMTELAPTIRIDRKELSDLFTASQRNVATLYEFWCFLALVDSLGRVCGEDRAAEAFIVASDGLSIAMRSGPESKISWRVTQGSRPLVVEAFFNRTFGARDLQRGSWSRKMRPDCSVCIRPEGGTPARLNTQDLEVWLHFDAKYRIDNLLAQLLSDPVLDESGEESMTFSGAKREDLLKMHAYRDAISRTAGAYVLYPGSQRVEISQYPGFEEILPGLGAFPIRPNAGGLPASSRILDRFLGDVLTHLASQVTRDERHRYWTATVNRPGGPILKSSRTTNFLDEPPADTDVLLGFIRTPEQLQWIERTNQYNIRAGDRAGAVEIGGRELGAKLILLYERRNGSLHVVHAARLLRWRPATTADLVASGYPDPQGDLYFVAAIEFVQHLPQWVISMDLEKLVPNFDGSPSVTTWWDVVRATQIGEP